MKKFIIGAIEIGNERPLVIPEMGINHGGNLNIAMSIVDAASRAGARIIKHQTHVVDDEMSHMARNIIPGNAEVSIYEIMKRCALDEIQERELKKYVESKGMIFLSTPFSRAAADRLEKMDVLAYKIGSGEMNNFPLLDYIASFGKPMIVSTGMNDIQSVSKAVEIIEKRNVPYALMHTTNLYPTPPKLVRLGAMQELQRRFPTIPIGLSDHTVNNDACVAAIALGAKIVERHFVDNKSRIGPDVVCSMDEMELKNLLVAADEIPVMLGGEKKAAKEENVTIDFAFATVVSLKKIKKGERFSLDNIWVKRPGIGEIKAEAFNDIIGKRACQDIDCDTHLDYKMIEED